MHGFPAGSCVFIARNLEVFVTNPAVLDAFKGCATGDKIEINTRTGEYQRRV